MSKVTIIQCDRCKKEVADRRKGATVAIGHGGRGAKRSPLDLCPDCSKSLTAWMNGKP